MLQVRHLQTLFRCVRVSAESLLWVLGPSVILLAWTTNASPSQLIHTKSDREN